MTQYVEADLLAGTFPYPRLALERGEGSYVWDTSGRRYLDFTAGLGVLALGHGRDDLAAVAQAQFAKLAHCSNLFANAPALALAQKLKDHSFAARVSFANSGAEANEAALKFARLVGRARGGAAKHAFVAFERGFHGRTMGALAVTFEPAYREPFAPMVPGARFAPLGDVAALDAVLGDEVCAVIVEPVQGEGGVHPCDPGFLRHLRARCDAHGAMLIFDEVQCGLGRTGALFAYEHAGVVPDMVTLAKPLAAGLPLGAILINDTVAAVLRPGQHGSTFAGGPVPSAVALQLLDVVCEPAFLAAVREQGSYLAARLQELAHELPQLFAGQRGLGLMQALWVRDPVAHPPARLVAQAREQGLLVTRAGHDAVRFLPPLNCRAAEIDEAMALMRQAVQGVAWAA